jgi:Kef-type K+ transport system membrane component KefB
MSLGTGATAQLLVALTLLLAAAHGIGQLFVKLRQPRAIGEIVGGVLLGPSLLSTLVPGAAAWVFPPGGPVAGALGAVYQLGLMLLMYASGAEVRGLCRRGEGKIVGILSVTGTLAPFAAGVALLATIDGRRFQGAAGNDLAFLLVFATAIAVTSIPVISRIMLDLGMLGTPFARIVLATAVVEDVVLYVVLAAALGLVAVDARGDVGLPSLLGWHRAIAWRLLYHLVITTGFFGVSLTVGPRLLRRALSAGGGALGRCNPIALHLLLLLGLTAGCVLLGVTPLFGALVAGMIAGGLPQPRLAEGRAALNRFALAFFVPVYFALIGLRLDLLRHFDPLTFAWFLAFACGVKGISVYLGARRAGESHHGALNFSVALNARGGPGIILASVAFDARIIDARFFAILVMLAVVTSLLAGSWLGRAARSGLDLRPAPERASPIQATGGGLAPEG